MLIVQLFRSLCVRLCVIFLLLGPFTPALPHPAAVASGYAKATKLLTQGKNFEQAILLLQTAVNAQPKDADYHLALGCAYVDRAISLGYANDWRNQYMNDKASYVKDLADWKADQKREPSNWPAPSKPPATFHAYTKDDGKPLVLSDAQATTRTAELIKEAQAEWQTAIGLTKSAKERARAEYFSG